MFTEDNLLLRHIYLREENAGLIPLGKIDKSENEGHSVQRHRIAALISLIIRSYGVKRR
jgi:hypothetical protein